MQAARLYITRDCSIFTLVSPEDFSWLTQWMWWLHADQRGKPYVRRRVKCYDKVIYLHRVVMLNLCAPPSPAHRYVDHINGNGLDNRRENLRWVTASENAKNLGSLGASIVLLQHTDKGV